MTPLWSSLHNVDKLLIYPRRTPAFAVCPTRHQMTQQHVGAAHWASERVSEQTSEQVSTFFILKASAFQRCEKKTLPQMLSGRLWTNRAAAKLTKPSTGGVTPGLTGSHNNTQRRHKGHRRGEFQQQEAQNIRVTEWHKTTQQSHCAVQNA